MAEGKEKTPTEEEIWDIIRKEVGSTPTMVFSVIGDSDNFVPKPWAKTVFQTALIEAAKSGGESWILFRGHGTGVSNIIRDAYRNYDCMEFNVDVKEKKRKKKAGEETIQGSANREDVKKINYSERHVKLVRIAGDKIEYDKSPPEHIEKTNAGSEFLLRFEKCVSEQKVSFFSEEMHFITPVMPLRNTQQKSTMEGQESTESQETTSLDPVSIPSPAEYTAPSDSPSLAISDVHHLPDDNDVPNLPPVSDSNVTPTVTYRPDSNSASNPSSVPDGNAASSPTPVLASVHKIGMPVPIAIIVCEGDIETIAHVCDALELKLPVIIIKGSGKAADLILDFLENSETLRKKASLLFGVLFGDNFKKLKRCLEKIEKKRDLIGVFDVNNDDPLMLSNIVGEAVVSCWAMVNILEEDNNDDDNKENDNKENYNKDNDNKDNDNKDIDKKNNGNGPKKSRPKSAFPILKTNGLAITGSSVTWELLKKNSENPEKDLRKQMLEDSPKKSRPYVLNPKYASPTSLPLYFYFGYQFLQESRSLLSGGRILLLEAIKANRCDYVTVFLDHGVKLKHEDLPELYEQTVSCKDCKFKEEDCLHMQWILKQIQEDHAKNLCHKYRSVTKKLKKEMENHKNPDEQKVKKNKEKIQKLKCSVAEAAKGLCRKILRYKETGVELKSKNVGTQADSKNNRPATDQAAEAPQKDQGMVDVKISDLLLWAIFANRKELAEICWLRSEDHLLTGLVCSALLQKLANKANNVKEQILANELEAHSKSSSSVEDFTVILLCVFLLNYNQGFPSPAEDISVIPKLFEQRCIAIMDGMYEENTKHTIELMDDDAIIWGIQSSPLTFAYENFMYDVVAHTCSQKNMNKQWYNNLAPDLVPFLKNVFRKPKEFLTAPLTKYIYNYIMFLSMLVMYSAFVLTSISTEYYIQDIARIFEYYVYFWGAGDFIEELISCFGCLEAKGRSHRGYYSRMKRYLYDFWNLVDLLSYALLITALVVRHFYPSDTFTIARRMFSLSLLVMYLRFLEVFLIHRRLGPTLIMIKEMLKDLFGFLFLAVFIVIGVGIYYHTNLWPDYQGMWDGDWTTWRIWKIIYFPYFQLYGELFNDFLEGKDLSDCSNITSVWQSNPSIERCPQEDWTVLGVSAIYMLFSNLLLVNLVIAMFSYTFERVQENSEKLWRFERYTVINDYEWRIPSPINLIFLPYRFLCCPGREGCCLDQCKVSCCRNQVDAERKELEQAQEFRRDFQKITAFKIRDKQ